MKRFVEGEDRTQSTLFPERLDDYIGEENPVRVIEAFIDELDLKVLGFEGIEPRTTGRHASLDTAKALYIRLPQPNSVKPSSGAGDATQCRSHVADAAVDAGPQDDCRVPQEQR